MSDLQFAVAQIGARRHYAVPNAINEAGMLGRFYTDVMQPRGTGWLLAALSHLPKIAGGVQRLRERRIPSIPRFKVTAFSSFALTRMIFGRKKASIADAYAHYAAANRHFGELVVKSGLKDSNAVYVFNGAGLEILQYAKATGRFAVLDQTMAPISYTERLLAEERSRWPDWELGEAKENQHELAEREQREWQLADRVICGSQFVVDSLQAEGADTTNCKVVPFCSINSVRELEQGRNHDRLRVLFVGSLELRKGIPYFYEAARAAHKDFDFRAVGPITIAESAKRKLQEFSEVTGGVARSEVSDHMRWADVMVLPTLAEGSANVCYEALCHGLPVITTPNAGSVIREGEDGYIVPVRDWTSIVEKLQQLSVPETLSRMSEAARNTASNLKIEHYKSQLLSALIPCEAAS